MPMLLLIDYTMKVKGTAPRGREEARKQGCPIKKHGNQKRFVTISDSIMWKNWGMWPVEGRQTKGEENNILVQSPGENGS